MIPHAEFRRLQLSQFDSSPEATNEESGCEFMNGLWYSSGEYLGASFLRPYEHREDLGAVCLDFDYARPELATSILNAIRLPLKPGISPSTAHSLLGNPTKLESDIAAPDFVTEYFECGTSECYVLACYFHRERLRAIDIIREDLFQKLQA